MNCRNIWIALCLAGSLLAADPAVDKAKKLLADKKYDEAITSLEAAHKAKPKSVEVQKELSEAYTLKGDSSMYNESAPPRQRYPDALRAYRKAVENDKDNKKAKDNVALIEGIYKQMGRPVPQ
jgi:tetratricopeptide (TPR) repeat protein